MDILELKSLADSKQAINVKRFFKTGVGQYGENDLFLGIKVPIIRKIAKKYYKEIANEEIEELIKNSYHEVRFLALVLMILKYEDNSSSTLNEEIFKLYLKNIKYINNWDLVDLSASRIVGNYCFNSKNNIIIYELASINHLWSNRIAVVSSHYFIKKGDFRIILELAEKFLNNKHDLIHKSVGWMLREMGKIDEKPLYDFLSKHHKNMPRTMLRYSIERLDKKQRMKFLR